MSNAHLAALLSLSRGERLIVEKRYGDRLPLRICNARTFGALRSQHLIELDEDRGEFETYRISEKGRQKLRRQAAAPTKGS